MSAFLFLPNTYDARVSRRLDLTNIASLFAECEEPAPRGRPGELRRTIAAALVALLAFGDTMFVMRPDVLTACLAKAQPTPAVKDITRL